MRVIASMISRETGQRCRVGTVNGAELYSPYVGQTEQNIKRRMRVLDEYDGPAILFLDEIDAIGRIRGDASNVHSDRFLGTLLGELEGIKQRNGVVVIAATNRTDILDPALRERFAWEVQLPRPHMTAARDIFRIHLSAELPYRPNSSAAPTTREMLIETAISQLYDPNAGNEIARLRFRDGKTRTVLACELMSGRLIEQVCTAARESAFQRHADGGEPGVCLEDMLPAVTEAIDRLSTTLTPRNVQSYLTDLPQDVDVIAIESIRRKVQRSRYIQ